MKKKPNPIQTNRARQLRKNMTIPERKLWHALRDRRLAQFKFRRQHPIGHFIVDFASLERQLVIEVDGESHDGQLTQDQRREEFIRQQGWQILRVTNDDVITNLEGVLLVIVKALGIGESAWRDGEHGQMPEGIE